jgi:hypothetical protein
MRKHAITILFLILAVCLYAVGAALPATGIIILGLLAEAIFWFRALGRGKGAKDQ